MAGLTEEVCKSRIENCEFMASSKENFERAALRLGISPDALSKFLRDQKREDLIAALGGWNKHRKWT